METLTEKHRARFKMVRAIKCEDRRVGRGRRGWVKRVVGLGLRGGLGSEDRVSMIEDNFGFGTKLGGLQTRRTIRGT